MTKKLQPWQAEAIREGGYTVKYTMVTPRFMLGIAALRNASLVMNDVFTGYVPDSPDSKDGRNEPYATALAILALLDTISMLPPEDYDGPLAKCRVLDVYYGKANYINKEGICVNWDKNTPDGNWAFWVLLPDDNYTEPNAATPLAKLLEREGFNREVL